jgi:rod shape-determining protein MreD
VKVGLFFIVMFLLFLLEGTVVQALVPDAWGLPWTVVPRFVLIGIVFAGLYAGRRKALYFGLFFGLLYDIVYTDIIGVYAFSMGITGYLAALSSQYFHQNWLLVFINVILVIFCNEWLTYGLYHLFHIAAVDVGNLMIYQILPTVLFNALFALFIFRPMSKLLEGADGEKKIA